MSDELSFVRLTLGESLAYAHLRQACHTLNYGGLCILPSDTCYSLAALLHRRDALIRLGSIIPDKQTAAIPLAFGSLQMVRQYVKLTARDERLIDIHCPGPLTLVCEITDACRQRNLDELLHVHGSIGVRIPDSNVERQLSIELQRPITTCAIRDDAGAAVRNFDDAVALVRARMLAHGEEFMVMAVRMPRVKYPEVSTVISLQPATMPNREELGTSAPYEIYIFRPGALEPEVLRDSLKRFTWADFEDFT